MEISDILNINTNDYSHFISDLPEEQQMMKIAKYLEWYLTRTESSFFFNEINFQTDFYYKSIILAPTGKRYATFGFDLKIHIFSYPQKTLLLRINQNYDCDMQFSHNGQLLGLMTPHEGILIYDIDNNEEFAKYQGNFSAFRFSKKSNMMAAAFKDGFHVEVWLKDELIFMDIRTNGKEIQCLEFSNNDMKLCAACLDGILNVWDIQNTVVIATLKSITTEIYCISFSLDDETIAFATNDRAVTLWILKDLRLNPVHKLRGHKKNVKNLFFYEDVNRLISLISMDEKYYMMIWSFEEKKPLGPLIMMNYVNVSSAIVLDNELLTVGLDASFKRWDLQSNLNQIPNEMVFGEIQTDVCTGNEMAFSQDGAYMVKVNTKPNVKITLWETKTGNPLRQIEDLPDDAGYIKDLTFSFDNKIFAFCYHYFLYLYDVNDFQNPLVDPLQIDPENPESFSFSTLRFSHSGILASGTDKGLICLWDGVQGEGELKKTFLKEHEGIITALEFYREKDYLASGDNLGNIRLWDLAKEIVIGEMDKHFAAITCIFFFHDVRKMISGSKDYQLKVWDLNDFTELFNFVSSMPETVPCNIDLNYDNKKLIVGYNKGELEIFKLMKKEAESLHFIHYHKLPILNVQFQENDHVLLSQSAESCKALRFKTVGSPVTLKLREAMNVTSDGSKIISLMFGKNIIITNTRTGELIEELISHQAHVEFCEISTDDSKMLSGAQDGVMNLWDLNKVRILIKEIKMTEIITCACFSNSDKIILGGQQGNIFVIEITNEPNFKITHSFKAHYGEIKCLDVDFNGNLASAGIDLKICLWNGVTYNKKIIISEGIKDEIKIVKFSFEGLHIFGAMKSYKNEFLKKWDAQTGELLSNDLQFSQNLCLNKSGKKIMTFINEEKEKWSLQLLDEDLDHRSAITIPLEELDRNVPPINMKWSKNGDLFCFFLNKVVVYFDLYRDEEIFIKRIVKIANFINNPSLMPISDKKISILTMNDMGRVYPFLYNLLHVMAYTDDYKSRFGEIVAALDKNYQKLDIKSFFEQDIHHRTPLDILFLKKNRRLLQEYLQYFMKNYSIEEAYNTGFFKYLNIRKISELMSIFYGQNEFISKVFDYLFATPIDFPSRFYYREMGSPLFITAKEPIMTKQKLEKVLEENKVASRVALSQVQVKAKCIYLPSLIDKTNRETCQFFLRICELSTSDPLFINDALLKILSFKWLTYARRAFFKEALIFLIFIAVYLFNCSYMLPLRVIETNDGVSFEDGFYQQLGAVLNVILGIFLFFYMKEEFQQVRVFGFKNYISNLWNCFDLPLITMLLIVTCYSFMNMFHYANDLPLTKLLHSITIFFFFLRLLSFARGFPGTGFMVRLVIQCMIDIKYFFVLMFLFIFGLSFASKNFRFFFVQFFCLNSVFTTKILCNVTF